TGRPGRRGDLLAVAGGLLLGTGALLSYGLVLIVFVPLAVAISRRRYRPLVIGALAMAGVVAAFAAAGFWWLDGLRATRRIYEAGAARYRPQSYFWLGNLGALALGLGPAPEEPTRILVVEDDATVAEVVSRYLEREGYQVEIVGDGRVALDRATARPPDLMVLDLMLPGLDGFEVFRGLRAVAPVPVIMLTARGDEDQRVAGLELGADDYVSKPFSPRE